MPQAIDPEWLGERLRAVRRERKLTLQEVADETKISVATLSRIERGEAKNLSSDTLLSVSEWTGIKVEMLQGSPPPVVGATGTESTPDIVELHLRADKTLDKRTAESLANLFRSVYEQLTEQMKTKKR